MYSYSTLIETLLSSITDLEHVSKKVLDAAKAATGSRHGFVGIIDHTTKALMIKTFSRLEDCFMKEKISTFYPDESGRYPALFGYAINERKAFFTNNPKVHPASKGVPEDHIPIERFLAVPLILNDRVLGLIALANPEKDYTEEDLGKVKIIGRYFALVLDHYWFEEELRVSKAFYEILFDDSPLPIIVVEENDIISQVSKAFEEQTGYTKEETVGKIRWQQLVHEKEIKRLTEYRKKRLAGEPAPKVYECQAIYKDKSVHNVLVYSKIVPGTKKTIAAWLDITKEKKLFKKIKRQQKKLEAYTRNLEKLVEEKVKELREKEMLATLGQMTLMVAHDLRNPLQAIANYNFLLNEAVKYSELPNDLKESFTKYIQLIEKNIFYTNKIVNDLQYLGKKEAKLEPVNLQTIVEEALKQVPKSECIKIILDVDNIQTQLDSVLIIRALSNIISNSVQAMPEGGTLTIKAKLRNTHIEFTVIDTGIGMSEEVKKNLFKPFYTTKSKGMGLGLTLVKHVVDLHQGTIEVESEPNKGTKITIKIPSIKVFPTT
ncbi:MAG: ATP-binding protein [Nitrososphaeria archaeon]|nr:ATP-binding protein [Nitrososphaeria archaeon]